MKLELPFAVAVRFVAATLRDGNVRREHIAATVAHKRERFLKLVAQVIEEYAADAACQCRKPEPGMLLEVARRFNVSLKDTYMVGDALRDVQAAAAAGARPVLVLTGKGKQTNAEGNLPPGTQVFADLAAFAEQLAP